MELMEERLKPYTRRRTTAGTKAASGLATAGTTSTATVHLDIQEDGRVTATDDSGRPPLRGPFVAFTYDGDLVSGDLIETSQHGLLEVLAAYYWDDLDPAHYEIALRVA